MTLQADERHGAREAAPLILSGLAWLWFLGSVALLYLPAALLPAFDYHHAWVTAHFTTIASTFAEVGIIDLGGVPIQNNLPLTTLPDVYANWPPVYGYALSFVIRLFGDGEGVVHAFACSVVLLSALLILLIIRRSFGTLAGLCGAALFLNMPIIATYGHMASQLNLCVALLLLALLLMLQATDPARQSRAVWSALGSALALALAVGSSWEAVLATPVLFGLALLRQSRADLHLSFGLGVTGTLTVLAVLALYFWSYPEYFEAVVERVRMRAGFGAEYEAAANPLFESPHFLQERAEAATTASWAQSMFTALRRFADLGPVGVIAILFFAVARLPRVLPPAQIDKAVFAILGAYFIWGLAMPHHMVIHDYQTLLVAPAPALAFGLLIGRLPVSAHWDKGVLTALLLAVVATSVLARVQDTRALLSRQSVSPEITFLQAVAEVVPEDAIVMHPSRSMVPVYYADAHVIRYVADDATLETVQENVQALCPECPVFLAIPASASAQFPRGLARLPVAYEDRTGVLLSVPGPAAAE